MNNVERFHNLMEFKKVDRLPIIEWAGWWDKTIERWKKEGLPTSFNGTLIFNNIKLWDEDAAEIREKYFGLDVYRQYGIQPYIKLARSQQDFPGLPEWGKGSDIDIENYKNLKKYLYPEEPFDKEVMKKWAEEQNKGEMVVWVSLDGFFGFPRELLGIERHFYAFFDSPEIIHLMNKDLLEYNLDTIEKLCKICTPDFMSFFEDMSYNNGPMISKKLFDEFMSPYYKKIVPVLKDKGIIPFIDSDGKIDQLIPWFAEVGIDGFLPLERRSGVDIVKLREKHPRLRMIGGYDKTVMNKNEGDMRKEFNRILPVMKQGGFIPSVDHQTPPEVSLENYKIYLRLLREYSTRV